MNISSIQFQDLTSQDAETLAGYFKEAEMGLRKNIETEILRLYPDCKLLVGDPDVNNQRSIAFSEKQGFKLHQTIEAKNALGNQKRYELRVRKGVKLN